MQPPNHCKRLADQTVHSCIGIGKFSSNSGLHKNCTRQNEKVVAFLCKEELICKNKSSEEILDVPPLYLVCFKLCLFGYSESPKFHLIDREHLISIEDKNK